MISPQFRPIIGGYERAAERLSTELVRQGHLVTVIAERRNRQWRKIEEVGNLTVRRLCCLYLPGWHMLSSLFSFAMYLAFKGHRFDIFHVHQYGLHAALTILFGRMLRKPVVLKLTNTGAQGIQSTLERRSIFTAPIANLHRSVNACLATSMSAVNEAIRFGIPRERILCLPNGVDTNIFMPCRIEKKRDIKKLLGLRKPLVVLYCGRLTTNKNPGGLIDAWSDLPSTLKAVDLVLLGEGSLRERLKEQIENLGLSQCVKLVGNQEDVLSWYQAADVFVLPSQNEGLSNSLLEAMSCGLPIVSTRVSGSLDIFSEADVGELVAVGEQHAMTAALTRLLADSKRREECGARAREYTQDKVAISIVAKTCAELYMRLLIEKVR